MGSGWRAALAAMVGAVFLQAAPGAASVPRDAGEPSEEAGREGPRDPAAEEGAPALVPVDLAVTPRWSVNRLVGRPTHNLLGLGLAATATDRLTGLQLAPGGAIADRVDGLQLAGLGAIASAQLRGVQVSGLASVAADEALALQLGGLVTAVGGSGGGLQLAGLGGVAGRDWLGLQGAGLAAVAGRDFGGLQLAGLAAVVGDEGAALQGGGLAAIVGGSLTGLQVAGLGGVVGERLTGLQLVGLAAIAGDTARGLQAAGLGALAADRMEGLQVGGLAAGADTLAGVQAAGGLAFAAGGGGLQLAGLHARTEGRFVGVQLALVNVAAEVRGAQVGLVNVADEATGVQVGLVNVARRLRGAPVGAVNWIGAGRWALEVWGDPATPLNVGFRSGTGRVYGLAGLGLAPFGAPDRLSAAVGVGAHLPLGPAAFLEPDLLARQVMHGWEPGRRTGHFAARLKAGLRVAPHLAPYLGVSLNLAVSDSEDLEAMAYGPQRSWTTAGGTHLRLWPGAFVGVCL